MRKKVCRNCHVEMSMEIAASPPDKLKRLCQFLPSDGLPPGLEWLMSTSQRYTRRKQQVTKLRRSQNISPKRRPPRLASHRLQHLIEFLKDRRIGPSASDPEPPSER
mmetsp:Transcript_22815/g.34241  ORF Transcript_22815/g.34241 Transcript_22815/m.34241 type:complete len:107 (+) Transcript_22815:243-563(+)